MRKYCNRCLTEIKDNYKYCINCGKKIKYRNLIFFDTKENKIIRKGKKYQGFIDFMIFTINFCFICFILILLLILWHSFRNINNISLFVPTVLIISVFLSIKALCEILKLGVEALKDDEDGKEARNLLTTLFSGLMTFFGLFITILMTFL